MQPTPADTTGGLVYLSREWMDESREVLNASALVQRAGRGTFSSVFQHHVTDMPAGYEVERVSFYSRFQDGLCAEVILGVIRSPDVTLSGTYEVWKLIHTGN
ncbi:MAG: hypothetical protein ACYC99_12285, partial [Candidatus Geothermincolia bacterium]